MDLGNFATEEEAARAYDGAARGMRGVSAHGGRKGSTSGTSGHFTLNFPTKEEEEQLEAAGLSPRPVTAGLVESPVEMSPQCPVVHGPAKRPRLVLRRP